MTSPAIKRIEKMLPGNGKQIHPFDWVNLPIFYDPEPEEGSDYTKRLRSATKFAYVAANEVSYGVKYRFRPSSMSNGPLAYDLAEDYKDKIRANMAVRFGKPFLTTQNLKANVASTEMISRVIFPNREEDFRAANTSEDTFRDDGIVVPIEFENVPRTQRANNAMSQGASFQDWTFECWWMPRVVDATGHIQDGARTYSRYANIEDMTADVIQLGYLDDVRDVVGPGKEYAVTDRHGIHINLTDRAWERARHIVDVVERGFHTDLAVATLIAEFQIDEWLRDDKAQPIGFDKLDKKKLHETYTHRSDEELARMDELKEIMLPYLAEKCMDMADYKRDPNLSAFIESHIDPIKKPKTDPKQILKTLFDYEPRGAYKNPRYTAAAKKSDLSKRFGDVVDNAFLPDKVIKRRSTEGGYFTRPAELFDDNLFKDLSIWEQAALPFAMGAMESFRLPENAPVSMFYVAEPKGGPRAQKYMKKNDVTWLKEAYADADPVDDKDGFFSAVISANMGNIDTEVTALSKDGAFSKVRGGRNIVTSVNFINIAKAAEKFRDFVAADGPQRFSPKARLALMTEWLDRNPQMMALRKGWTTHHDEVQLAVRGVMIATGLVERPFEGGNYRMEIFESDPKGKNSMVKMDLADMILSLGNEVKRLMNDGGEIAPAREHYVSMARLIQILDMYNDPANMNYEFYKNGRTGQTRKEEIIAWKNVDPALMAFTRDDPAKFEAVMQLRHEVREEMLQKAVGFFNQDDLKGLGPDYEAAWQELHGLDSGSRRKKYEGRRIGLEQKGPV